MASQPLESSLSSKIRALAHSNPKAARLFEDFSTRERDRAETPVDRIAELSEGDRREAFSLMKQLEEIGLGRAVIGRRGAETRFVWKYGIRAIGRAAKEDAAGSPQPATLSETGEARLPSDSYEAQIVHASSPPHSADVLTHQFALRPNFIVRLELPADLNGKEAERLSAFIASLPF